MRVALINLIIQTVDRPKRTWKIFGATPNTPLETDEEVHFIKLAKAMARQGHDVTVFISDAYRPIKTTPHFEGFKTRYLKTKCRWLFPPAYVPLTPSLYRDIKQGGFDLVQSGDFFSPGTLIASLACRSLAVWQEVDRYPSRWLPRLAAKIFYKTIGRLIAPRIMFLSRSSSAAKFLNSLSYPEPLDVVHSGVDTKVFTPLSLEEAYILMVSRLSYYRGLDFLLAAFQKIRKAKPQIKLLIKGEGPYYGELLGQIDNMRLNDAVNIDTKRSNHSEMNQIYNRAFLTIIPATEVLLPFTCYESMSAGKPVVSRHGRGLRDIIIEGRTGFVVSTPEEMAKKTLWLLNHSEERFNMGKGCRRLMLDYDLDAIAAKLVDNYRKIVTG